MTDRDPLVELVGLLDDERVANCRERAQQFRRSVDEECERTARALEQRE
ncbi:hypothetical protein [Natrinema salsiterrestre]|uniref:Uncharacterized protein n=1 Tax=Natrinema salsiterrestre TaxID=2950540 RepID=A0A9Q4PZ34_9EURY|nr:hypothetical protein [Natrinema salsiterrestre]MDF9744030.1 hypothetical protein [Natrinema salsiterrestre]